MTDKSSGSASSSVPDSPLDSPLDSEDTCIVPWTIVNKYYSADVHFQIQTVNDWGAELACWHAPAVIFVWTHGEVRLDKIKSKHSYLRMHTAMETAR